jgi:hypothetical protein
VNSRSVHKITPTWSDYENVVVPSVMISATEKLNDRALTERTELNPHSGRCTNSRAHNHHNQTESMAVSDGCEA